MDVQGTPIGSSNQGAKNTSDPLARQNPKQENPGPIASDSLAAESYRSGGAFSENRNPEPQRVKGSSSTFANTDISGAKTLKPAPSAAERDVSGGEPPGEGDGSEDRNIAGKSLEGDNRNETQNANEQSDDVKEPSQSYSEVANPTPSSDDDNNNNNNNNTTTTTTSTAKDESKEDFPDDPKHNASFTADIGADNDPGRLAEAQIQHRTAQVAGGSGPKQREITGDGQFDVLRDEQEL